MNLKHPKALLIRVDRIGDLICTFPVDQSPAMKKYECSWLITKGLEFIPENSLPKRNYHTTIRKFSLKNFWNFYQWIKKENFSLSISFHAPWWINFSIWLCRIPQRLGNYSQWHSFLFLSHGLRQKRSLSHFHESEYNQQLIDTLLKSNKSSNNYLKLTTPLKGQVLKQHNLLPHNYLVIHPGMGGSALNWPIPNYTKLIQQLGTHEAIVITGTQTDAPWISPIRETIEKESQLSLNVQWLDSKLSAEELLDILSHAKAVIAPSTGVAHIAASLSVPTIGLYPLIKSQTPIRWAPRGRHVQVLTPPKETLTDQKQMQHLKLNDVLNSVKNL